MNKEWLNKLKNIGHTKKIILVFIIMISAITICLAIYGTYAYDNSVTENLTTEDADYEYNFNIGNNTTGSITVNANEDKYVDIKFTNSNSGSVKYKLYYTLSSPSSLPSGVTISSSEDNTEGTVSSGESITFTIHISNTSSSNITIILGAKADYVSASSITLDSGQKAITPLPVSFSTDSWATIAANTTSSVYNVGATKCVALDGFTTTNDNGCSNGEFLVRIANNTTPSDCDTSGYSQTACGFVIEFVDIIITHVMNSTATNVGSWPASEMRTYVNEDIYEALPGELSSVIINTSVVSGYGSSDSSNFTSTDKIYLLSAKELYNYTSYDNTSSNTRQLDYYSELGVTESNYSGAIKYRNGSAGSWWLRAPNSGCDYSFFYVSSEGYWIVSIDANDGSGVAPAFRIGS